MNAMSEIRAPMTGSVVHILAEVGQMVKSGQVLLIIEAMKMEHEIRAERDAQVLAVMAQLGDMVEADEVLLKLSLNLPVDSSVGADETKAESETTALQGGRAQDALFAVADGDTPLV